MQLKKNAKQLGEMVVKGLSAKKTRKSLIYTTQGINADELNKVKHTNEIGYC